MRRLRDGKIGFILIGSAMGVFGMGYTFAFLIAAEAIKLLLQIKAR